MSGFTFCSWHQCPADARAGEFYKLRVKDLSPTQFAVGKEEVAARVGRMAVQTLTWLQAE